MQTNGFHTLKGYQLIEDEKLTPALEDYLEMIIRLINKSGVVRVRDLSDNLNVRPPSATKMIRQLNDLGYLNAEKYGGINLTKKGRAAGEYLLYRHEVIYRFLSALNEKDELEETEKIEHFLSPETVNNLASLKIDKKA